jgi:hypothetical protein
VTILNFSFQINHTVKNSILYISQAFPLSGTIIVVG